MLTKMTRLASIALVLQLTAFSQVQAFSGKSPSADLVSDEKLIPIIVDGVITPYTLEIPESDTVDDWSSMGIKPNSKICFKSNKGEACKIAKKNKPIRLKILYEGSVRVLQFTI